MATTRYFMLVRVDSKQSIRSNIRTDYTLFPQKTRDFHVLYKWIPAYPLREAHLFAGILNQNDDELQVLGREKVVDDLVPRMKMLVHAEVERALNEERGDVEMSWELGALEEDRKARMVMQDGANTRYVWWEIVVVDVVGA